MNFMIRINIFKYEIYNYVTFICFFYQPCLFVVVLLRLAAWRETVEAVSLRNEIHSKRYRILPTQMCQYKT